MSMSMGTFLLHHRYIPLPIITTQQPGNKFAAFSPNSASAKSEYFTSLSCRRRLKSSGDACIICLVMYGRIRGNPSDDIRKAHGEEPPSRAVCLSCKIMAKYISLSYSQAVIKNKRKLKPHSVMDWHGIQIIIDLSNKLLDETNLVV